MPRHNPLALYGFLHDRGRGRLTSFYSWRLIFKTFHGEPHDQEHYEAAHESPLWMLIPIGLLAIGSIAGRLPVQGNVRRPRRRGLLPRVRSKMNPHILEEMEHIPASIGLAADGDDGDRLRGLLAFYIRRPYIPVELARQHQLLYQFLLNKWYFDELYDFIFVRPAKWIGRFLWKDGDGWLIDGFGPGRRVGARARCHPQCRAAADRLSLPLRLCHADRGRRLHHLVHVRRGRPVMTTWPILSVVTFLPLVGALLIYLGRGDDEAAQRNARWIALWTTLVTFAVSLILVCRFDPASAGLPVRREDALARQCHHLSHGRRRHFAAVRDPDHRA